MNSFCADEVQKTALFSVIVPAYQAEGTLEACLDALTQELQRTPQISAEVIVVDDGSHDQTAAIAARFPCELVRLPQNRGAAAARNAGLQHARGLFVWFLDADGIVTSGTLSKIHESLAEHGVDAVFGIFSKDLVYRNYPSQYKLHLLRSYFLRIHKQTRGICTAICALRRDAIVSVGGFDESFRGATVEDVDMGERLAFKGFQIRFIPEIQVEHRKHYTWRSLAVTQFRRAFAMGRLFFEKSGLRETARTGFFFLVPISFGSSLVLAPLTLFFAVAAYFLGFKSLIVAGALYTVMMVTHGSFLRRMFSEHGPIFAGATLIVLPLDFSLGAFSASLGWGTAFLTSVRKTIRVPSGS